MNTVFNYQQSTKDVENISAGFAISKLEQMQIQERLFTKPPGKINHFEIIWLKKGNTALQINDVDIDFAESNLYIITPGNSREYTSFTGVEGYCISFTAEFILLFDERYETRYSWADKYLKLTSILIEEEMQDDLDIIVKKMMTEYSNYFNQRQELLKALLNIFILYFSRNVQQIGSDNFLSREDELVRRFLKLRKENFLTKKMVSDYAGMLCVSANYLNRTVKKITGFTASYHIQQEIIIAAKKLAFRAGVNMKEIAYHLGFETPAHFSKFFKNNCGVNFTDFKKGIRG
jgi:AraC family transcriptional regulator, transcriptional activator of pobA